MSDDDDYMSDKFLQGSEKDVPPSLLYRHADKRQFDIMKKKAELREKIKEKKSMHIVEHQQREEGLASAITSDNKGFAMLMKMGYKPGQGIGKLETGIVEPIPVELKSDRQGLGKTSKPKETRKRKSDSQVDGLNTKDFRGRISQKRAEQLAKADLYKSQKVCEQLDARKQIEKPREIWFWPAKTEEKTDEEQIDSEESDKDVDNESLGTGEQLEILTNYLRDTYFYCIWCGVAFDNQNDLTDNCPGMARDDH